MEGSGSGVPGEVSIAQCAKAGRCQKPQLHAGLEAARKRKAAPPHDEPNRSPGAPPSQIGAHGGLEAEDQRRLPAD